MYTVGPWHGMPKVTLQLCNILADLKVMYKSTKFTRHVTRDIEGKTLRMHHNIRNKFSPNSKLSKLESMSKSAPTAKLNCK